MSRQLNWTNIVTAEELKLLIGKQPSPIDNKPDCEDTIPKDESPTKKIESEIKNGTP